MTDIEIYNLTFDFIFFKVMTAFNINMSALLTYIFLHIFPLTEEVDLIYS